MLSATFEGIFSIFFGASFVAAAGGGEEAGAPDFFGSSQFFWISNGEA